VSAGTVSTLEETNRTLKQYRVGTHRLLAPDETLRRVTPHLPSMGITRVANITGLDVIGVPVVAVIRPNSRSVSVAQGKGIDLASAKASGLMEAIENYHAERIRLPLVLANWSEIRERGPTVDLHRLPRIVGSTVDPFVRLLWIQGHEVLGRTPVWLPFEIVHSDYRVPFPPGSGALMMNDSGIASGNHPLEATSHGICELVERDAVTLWQLLGEEERAARRIDPATVDDEPCRSVLDRFARAQIGVAVWEVTSDVELPTFYCTIVDSAPNPWRGICPASGSGCHPSREVALLRALTEAAQARLTVIAGSRDDIGLATYARGHDQDLLAQTIAMMASKPRRTFREAPTHETPTIREDVSWELERLHHAGIEQVVVVDLSLPDVGIPVVRVVIPGLEGLCGAAGYCPGERAKVQARHG
jgi:YcaO-like protein with predicted kinase domain